MFWKRFWRKKQTASQETRKPELAQRLPSQSTVKASLLSLESRLMFDAAAAATAAEVNQEQVSQEQADSAMSAAGGGREPTAAEIESQDLLQALSTFMPVESRHEVAFVDPTVPDYQSLIAGMGPNVQIVMLDGGQDGVEQMAAALSGRTGIDAIHIISHGAEGQLNLGTGSLTHASMTGQYADELATIQRALSTQADILVYGCNFAQGDVGQDAATLLSQLTGADVAASTDATGAASLGGDWLLETQTGTIETQLAVRDDVQMDWVGLLDISTGLLGHWTFDTNANDSSGNSYNGTLTNGAVIDTTDATDKVGVAKLSLDGTNDYVDLTAHKGNFEFLTQGSVAMWIKTTDTSAELFSLSDTADSDSTASLWITASGKLGFDVWQNNSNLLQVNSVASVNDGLWHHVAVTVNASGNTLYIDGVQASVNYVVGNATSTTFFDDVTGIDVMQIGRNSNSGGARLHYTGLIDDARFYNRALTGADMAELVNATPTITNLSGDSLSYTEGDGAVVIEQGGNALVDDGDSANFDTGTLTVSIPAGGDSTEDVLSIRNQGTGAGQISVSGYGVAYGGTLIGSFTGGANGSPLVITFNSSATPTAVTALIKNITYQDTDTTAPTTGARTVRFLLTDGDGGASATYDTTVTVTAADDAPTFTVGDGIVQTAIGTSHDYGQGVLIQPDGKMLVSGGSIISGAYQFALVRYNADGTLDTSFGGTGKVTTDVGASHDQGGTVALQADGKIVVAGWVYNGANNDFGVVRYNADGSLDTTFNGTGKVTTAIGAGEEQVRSVTLQADGKIVVAGSSYNGANYDFALVRYNTNGSLDTTFNGTGKVTGPAATDNGYDVAVQADGKILVGGVQGSDFAVTRFSTNGTVDTTFGTSGTATVDIAGTFDYARAIVVQPDGKIVLAGSTNSDADFALVRLTSSGALDTTFNGTGKVVTNFGATGELAYDLVLQADGKLVAVGQAPVGGTTSVALARYNTDGSLDTSFGGTGKVTTNLGSTAYGLAATVQADGQIVVTGQVGGTTDMLTLRYNTDGTLDTRLDLVNTLNGAPTFTENGSAVVLDANVQIFDAELSTLNNFSGATLTLARNGGTSSQDVFSATGTLSSISAASGNVVVGGTTIGTYTNSSGTLVFTFNSNATNTLVNSAMQQIAYSNSSDAPPASAQINWTFSDGNSGSQGTGGALTAAGSTTVTITAVNDAPVLDNSGTMTFTSITEDDTNNSGQTVASIIASAGGDRITDTDAGASEGIAVTSLNSGSGTWQYNTGSGWTNIGTVSESSALLLRSTDSIRFVPDGEGADSGSISFRAWDQTSGTAGSKVTTGTTGTVLDQFSSASFSNNNGTQNWAGAWIETDAGGAGAAAGSISISSNQLRFDADTVGDNVAREVNLSGATSATLSFSYNNTLTGADRIEVRVSSDGGANYTTLTNGTFSGSLLTGSGSASFDMSAYASANTRIQFIVTGTGGNDRFYVDNVQISSSSISATGAFSSATETASITVTAANDAPVLADTALSLTVAEDAGAPVNGTAVGSLLSAFTGGITDVDSGAAKGIAITGSNETNGTWYYTTNGGSTWTAVSAVSNTSALLLADNGSTRLYFAPAADYNGTSSAALTVRAWDQTSGTAGTKVSTASNGGTTAFSSATDTIDVSVTAVNDAPVLTPVGPVFNTSEGAASVSAYVSDLLLTNLTDVDSGAVEGIAVFGISGSGATIEYSLDGSTWVSVGSVSATNALLLRATDQIRIVPDADNGGTLYVDYRGWDQTSGTAGTKVNASVTGGTTAFSSASDQAVANITSVNDAPVLADTALSLTVTEDAGAPSGVMGSLVSAFTGGITDVDSGAAKGLAITGSNETNGTWYYTTNGGTNWTAVGSVSNTSALLLADNGSTRLYFAPAADYNGTSSAALTVRAWDQTSGTAGTKVTTASNGGTTAFSTATDTIDVSVTAVNDVPVITGLAGDSLAYTEGSGAQFIEQWLDANVTDIDSTDFAGGTLTVSFVAGSDSAEDVLAVFNQGSAAGQIGVSGSSITYGGVTIGSFTGGSGGADLVITFNGNATPARVSTLVSVITYQNTDTAAPTTGTRTVRYVLTDGDGGTSLNYDATVTVSAVNDAPILADTALSITVAEDAGAPSGAVGALLSAFTGGITDVDSGASKGIAITGSNETNGTWYYTTNGGTTWTAVGSVSNTSALLLADNANTRLYFAPSADYNGTSSAALTVRAWDQTSGTAGSKVTTASNGGTTAFSSATDTVDVTVTAVNDAPVVMPIAPDVTFVEGGLAQVIDATGTIVDVDSANFDGGVMTLSISANGTVDDRLQVGNFGTGPGQVGLSGSSVTYGGTVIGTVSGGTSGSDPLVVTFNTSATPAAVQEVYRSIQFTNVSDNPSIATRTLTIGLTDGDGGTATPQTELVYVQASNDAPVLADTALSLTVAEDAGAPSGAVGSLLSAFTGGITDVDSGASKGIAITGSNETNGTWYYTTNGGTNWTAVGTVDATSSLLLADNGSTRLYFSPSADYNGTSSAALTVRAWDQTSGTAGSKVTTASNGGTTAFSSATDTIDVTVSSVNDAPVITMTGGSVQYNENASPVVIDTGLTLSDVDSATMTGATVQITVAYNSAQDVLAFTNQLGITGSWDSVTGTLTLSGTTTVANYQTALRSITYQNTSDNPTTSVRTVSFIGNDGAASSTAATRQVQVVAWADAPETANVSASGAEDATAIAVTLTGTDIDGTVNNFRVDSLPANGTLYSDAGCTLAVTAGTDYAATGNALTLYFKPTVDWNGDTTFQFSARDDWGAYDATPGTATITVMPVNDAPINLVPSAQSTNEDTSLVFSSGNGNQIAITDPDGSGGTFEVTVSVTNGTLTLAGTTGLTFTTGDGTSDSTMTFSGTVASINTALNGLSYNPTADYNGSATLTITSVDNTLESLNIDANLQARYIFDGSANDVAPGTAQNGTLFGNATYVTDGTRGQVLSLDGNGDYVEITGVYGSPANVTLATWVNLSSPGVDGGEVFNLSDRIGLRVDEGGGGRGVGGWFYNGSTWEQLGSNVFIAGTGWHHVAYSFDDANNQHTIYIDGVAVVNATVTNSISYTGATNSRIGSHMAGGYPFNGRIDDARVYNRALTAAEIASLANNQNLNDSDSVAITVNAVNDAPVLADTALSLTVAEDAGAPSGAVGSLVSAFTGGITDVDSGAAKGLAITGSNETNGTWYYTTNGGTNWTAVGAVSNTSALLLADNGSTRLYFAPGANYNGTSSAALTVRAWDQTSGTAGTKVSTASNGGTTAFSSATDTVDVTVTAVNDAPVLTFGEGDKNFTEGALAVMIDALPNVSDLDSTNFDTGTLTITISANPSGDDRVELLNTGMGAGQIGVSGTNVYYGGTLIGTQAGGIGAVPFVVTFNANADATIVGAVMANIRFWVADDTPSTATRTVEAVLTDGDGGTSLTASKQITVTAVNDAPTITSLSGDSLNYSEGDGAVVIEQGGNALVADVDSTNFDTGTLTVSIPSGGDSAEDVLSIRNQGTAVGQIGVSGSTITYGGTTIGTFTGGSSGSNLVITLNSNATPTAVTALVKNITYENTDTNAPTAGARTVRFVLTDGDGGTSTNYDTTVTVGGANDAPTDIVFGHESTPEQVVNTYTSSDQQAPSIAALPNGGWVTVWESLGQDGSTHGVYGQRFDADGTKVGAEFLINQRTSDSQYGPVVSAFADGRYVVTWTDQVSGVMAWVMARVFNADGTAATAEFQVSPGTDDANEGYMPAVQVLDSTRFVVVWSNEAGADNWSQAGRIYDSAGVLQGAQFSVGTQTATGIWNNTNRIDRLADGGFAVTWRYDSSTTQLRLFNSDGSARTATIALPGNDAADVAVLRNGNVAVAYADGGDINAVVYDANGVLQVAEFNVNVGATTGTQSQPRITASDDGFVVAWNSDTGDGSGSGVFAQRFTAGGSALGGVVPVNTTTAGAQTNVDLVQTSTGQVRVVWSSQNLDGNGSAVASRVLGTPGATVAENAANGTWVADALGFRDLDGLSGTYSLVNDAGGRFAIDASTGTITVADGSLLNYEAATSHTVTVRVTDAGGATYDETVTINLTNVNEAPTGADATITINEDTAHTLTTANFGFSDVDAGDSLSAVRIDTIPTAGTLTLSGVAVTAGQVITVADITVGNLVFTPAADANGTGYASFTFSVRDSNNAYDPAPNTLTITVTAQNDAPVNTVPGAQTVNEDTALSISGLSVTDVDGNLSTTQLVVTNGTVTVSLAGGATISAGANGSSTLTLSGTQAQINAALATLTYQGTLNFTGSDTLTMTSTDSTSASDMDTVAITVTAVNDATVVTGGTSGTGNEDTTVTGTLTATDVEGLSDGTVFAVSANATNGTASIDPATGLWSYTPNADFNGSDSFTVTITDDAGNTATQVISVTVTPVADITNDSLTTNEDTAISANVLTGTNGATADSFEGTPVLTGVTQGANGTVTFLANGTVTYTPNANFAGSDSFTYTITSGGVTETATVTVTVTAVNDPTVVTGGTSGSGNEDTTLTATDVEGLSDGTVFTVTAAATNGTASINPATGLWSYQPNPDFNGSDSFTVTITDDAGNTTAQVISVIVMAVNDAPTVAVNTGSTVAEGGTDTISSAELAVTDVEQAAGALTYTIGTGPAYGRLELTTAPGTTATTFTQADLAANRLIYLHNGSETTSDSFTFTVSDGVGGSLGPTTMTLTITPVNDMPTIMSDGGGATAAITVLENVSAVTIVTGADVDLPTQTLTYSLSGGADQARFTINTATGVLTFIAPPDFEVATDVNGDNVYVVQVEVLDSQGASTTQTIQVTVTDVGESSPLPPPTVPPILVSPLPPLSPGGPTLGPGTPPPAGPSTPVETGTGSGPSGPTVPLVEVGPISQGLLTLVPAPDRPVMKLPDEVKHVLPESEPGKPIFFVNDEQGRPLFSVLPVEPTPTLEPEPPDSKPSVSELLMTKLDEMTVSLERAVNVSQEQHELVARITAVTGTALSVGFIAWALRSGAILASLLATMPAWQHFDPLPVVKLNREERKRRRDAAVRDQQQEMKEFKGLTRVLDDQPPLKRTA